MSNYLFQDTKAVGIPDDKPTRLTFSPAGLPGVPSLEDEFWITDVQGGIEPNYQIMYAFSNNIYLNAFTPRLTVFQLEGVYVPSKYLCGQTLSDDSSQQQPAFMQMYWEYNIVDANADPENQKILTVTFNNITIKGFLVKNHIQRYNQNGIDGHRFVLHLLGFMETGKLNEADIQDKLNEKDPQIAALDARRKQEKGKIDALDARQASQRLASRGQSTSNAPAANNAFAGYNRNSFASSAIRSL